MTTQELYKKLNAGEITEQKFLYEVRRDQNLHFISKFNNFKDTVRILKNKGIISEEKQEVEIYAKTIDMVNPYEYARGMDYESHALVSIFRRCFVLLFPSLLGHTYIVQIHPCSSLHPFLCV